MYFSESLSRAVNCPALVGGQAIFAIIRSGLGTAAAATAGPPTTMIPLLGISSPELACYAFFWAAQVYIVCKGIESIRVVEQFAAPLLIVLCVSLFAWAYAAAARPSVHSRDIHHAVFKI